MKGGTIMNDIDFAMKNNILIVNNPKRQSEFNFKFPFTKEVMNELSKLNRLYHNNHFMRKVSERFELNSTFQCDKLDYINEKISLFSMGLMDKADIIFIKAVYDEQAIIINRPSIDINNVLSAVRAYRQKDIPQVDSQCPLCHKKVKRNSANFCINITNGRFVLSHLNCVDNTIFSDDVYKSFEQLNKMILIERTENHEPSILNQALQKALRHLISKPFGNQMTIICDKLHIDKNILLSTFDEALNYYSGKKDNYSHLTGINNLVKLCKEKMCNNHQTSSKDAMMTVLHLLEDDKVLSALNIKRSAKLKGFRTRHLSDFQFKKGRMSVRNACGTIPCWSLYAFNELLNKTVYTGIYAGVTENNSHGKEDVVPEKIKQEMLAKAKRYENYILQFCEDNERLPHEDRRSLKWYIKEGNSKDLPTTD